MINEHMNLFGFKISRSRELPELKARLHEYRHEKTGASLIWLERPEQNKTFSVSFKTIPEDDSGVFHILEHCVLGGSKKYAVREPFAELMKSSVNTFLNAMTFSDKTMYPVASRNETDFLNLIDVYLDGVFNPSVLEEERIFRQEGWGYAFDEEGKPSYQGVVYNEMKGASSSLDRKAHKETIRLLFPDSPYRFDSGGDPEAILDLTYEDFKAAHRRFYHPSNAFFFLDGQVPLEAVLEKLDQDYLSAYDRVSLDGTIARQSPVAGLSKHDYEIAADEDPRDKCRLTLAQLVASWDEIERKLAIQILCDVLAGSNEAPLKKYILDQELAQDFQMYLSSVAAQSWLTLEAQNTSPDRFDRIKTGLVDQLRDLADKGLNKADLLASLNQLYYQELDPSEPRGVILAMTSMSTWLYGGDPAQSLSRGLYFESLKEKINSDYFEVLVRDLIPDEDRLVEVQSFPSAQYGKDRDAREASRLEAQVSSWTAGQRQALMDQAAALEAWQMAPDTAEALASLPSLCLEDLAEEPDYRETEETSLEGLTILRHPSPAEGILYLKLYFDCSDSPLEDLAGLNFMAQLLGQLATQDRDAQSLLREVKTHIGQLDFSLTPMGDPDHEDQCRLFFTVTCSVLESEANQAIQLISEILTRTHFDDKTSIYAQMLQLREYLRQMTNQAAHYFGVLRVKGHSRAKDAAKEALGGLSSVQWLKAFLADFDTQWDAFRTWAQASRDRLFSRERLTLSLTGQWEADTIQALIDAFPSLPGPPPGLASYQVAYPRQEGVLIPSAVSYACLGCPLSPYGGTYSGAWLALEQILSLEFLWNKIRVQGGAYGAGFSIDRSAACAFYSYRDPSPGKSLESFRQSATFIRAFCEDKDDIDRYIMGKIASLDPELSYKAQADLADNWYFTGFGPDKALAVRRQLMETKPQDLLPLADILGQALLEGAICLLGSAEALADHKDLTLVDIS